MLPRKMLNFGSSEIRFPAFGGSLTLFYYCFEHFYTFYQTFYSTKGRAAAPSAPLNPHLDSGVCTIPYSFCTEFISVFISYRIHRRPRVNGRRIQAITSNHIWSARVRYVVPVQFAFIAPDFIQIKDSRA